MRHDIKQKVRHLCGYITDRSAVLNHINRDYGTSYKMRDLEEALISFPKPRKKAHIEDNSLPLTPPVSTHNGAATIHWRLRCLSIMQRGQRANRSGIGNSN